MRSEDVRVLVSRRDLDPAVAEHRRLGEPVVLAQCANKVTQRRNGKLLLARHLVQDFGQHSGLTRPGARSALWLRGDELIERGTRHGGAVLGRPELKDESAKVVLFRHGSSSRSRAGTLP